MKPILLLTVLLLLLSLLSGVSAASDAAAELPRAGAVTTGHGPALVTGSGDDSVRVWLEGTRYAPRIRAEGARAPRLQADLDRIIGEGGYTPGSVSILREGRYLHLAWEDRTYRTFRTFTTRVDLDGIEPPSDPVQGGEEAGLLGLYRGRVVVKSTDPLTRRTVISERGAPGQPFVPDPSIPPAAVTLSRSVDLEEGLPAAGEIPVTTGSLLQATNTRQWTYFCYMDGDNNLDPYGDDDFAEFLAAGSTASVTLIVLKDDRGSGNTHLYVINTGGGSATEIPLKNVNPAWSTEVEMGDPATLSTVAQWVIASYPSEHLAIDLWDHGSGLGGLLSDTATSMDMKELRTALSGIASFRGRPVDLLAYDACSMGQVEVYYQVKAFADVQVGSSDLVPADGFPYHKPGASVLGDLGANPEWTPRDLGARMVEHYRSVYPSGVLSATDMDLMDRELVPAVTALAQAMKHRAGIGHGSILQAAEGAVTFRGNPDLGHFTGILAANQSALEEIRDACAVARSAVSSAVFAVAPGNNTATTGLTISMYQLSGYQDLQFSVETPWNELLDALAAKKDRPNSPPTVALASPGDGAAFLSPAPLPVSGNAGDPDGILRVEVKLDRGDWVPADGTSSWSAALDTTGLAPGTHRVWARSLDSRGTDMGDRDYSPPQYRTIATSSVPARYHTWSDVEAELSALEMAHPDIIRRHQIGTSIEGRPLRAVEVTDHPGTDEGEPAILVQALQHADESIAKEVALSYLAFLAEHYGSDPRVTGIVDSGEIWFIPVANPDGLVYTENSDPDWRKNRRPNGDGTYGVDLNRNFEGAMNGDPTGAWCQVGGSHDTRDETYCGLAPSSEPESRAVRDLVVDQQFRGSLNYHSAGESVGWPWGYTTSLSTPDNESLARLGSRIASRIPRISGTGTYTALQSSRFYAVAGEHEDWIYGFSRLVQNRIVYPYVIEVGETHGPPADQVPAIAAAHLESQLYFSEWILAGNLAPATPAAPMGPSGRMAGTPATFTIHAQDPDGDRVRVLLDWGDGTVDWSGFTESGGSLSADHAWVLPGVYSVKAMAFDVSNASSPWSDAATITVSEIPDSRPPARPAIPAGPSATQTIFLNRYTASATDPDGDPVVLLCDWGDGTWTESGPVPSGTAVQASHAWTGPGTFTVTVQATDSYGMASDPSPPLAVRVLQPDATLTISDRTNTKVSIGSAYNRRWTAQGFSPKKPWITGASLPLRRQGIPPVPLTVMIRTAPGTSAGSTLSLAMVSPSQVETAMGWVNVTFETPADATGRATVYLVLSTGSTASSSAYYQGYLDSTHPYARGIWYSEYEKDGDADFDLAALLTFAASASSNHPPPAPAAPAGPPACTTGIPCQYTVILQDPDGDTVRATFDWGDGSTWEAEPVPSGTAISGSHAWTSPGTYAVRVMATDASGSASGWSSILTVMVSDPPDDNHPPEIPSTPSGPSSGTTGESLAFASDSTDPDGDVLTCTFDWGDGSTWTSDPVSSGSAVTGVHAWPVPGTFAVRVMATDNRSASSGWSETRPVTITGTGNRPPEVPSSLSGPEDLTIGSAGEYRVVASDQDGDTVACIFDWGDGAGNETPFQATGSTHAASHAWADAGTFLVRAKARDAEGAESEWSVPLSVVVSQPAGTLVIASDPNTRVYLGSASSRRWHSQGFRATGSRITGAALTLGREGSPAIPLQVMIRTTPNPATGITRGQATLTPDRVGTGPAAVEVTFDTAVTVKEGGLYYLVVSTGTAYEGRNHYYGYADYHTPYTGGIWYYEQQPQGNANLDMVATLRFG
ncbi:MAG: PKD domain-containing protein [Methanomicrobiales archaeon]|nr:PKD domain-containing protein [Methanomicrobiales archaeon]